MTANHFDVLILIARPASGKSEIIDHLKRADPHQRIEQFHVAPFKEIDDFPMLWTWFEEDEILVEMGHPRLHTDADNYFINNVLWHLLIRRISADYEKLLRDEPGYHAEKSVLIEFSRGGEHGGYVEAFQHLSEDVLKRAAVLYLEVSYEESVRKNQRRFNPDRPDSILEHGLPDEKMERLYKDDDFRDFSASDPEYLTVKGVRVPYVVFENEDDVTTNRPDELDARLRARMATLWALYRNR